MTLPTRLGETRCHIRPSRRLALRRLPLVGAMALALTVGAGLAKADDVIDGIRPEALAYLAGRAVPADMSWEHKVQLEALARHYGLPSPLPADGRATIPVTNCNDAGPGSLRNAIASAANNDTIDASGLTCSTISLTTGSLVVNQNNLMIVGRGRGDLTIQQGAKYGRIIRHQGTGTLSLSGMTIQNGRVSPSATEAGNQGGCVFSNGNVALGNGGSPSDARLGVRVSGCAAIARNAGTTAEGGGVFANGGFNMYGSVISGCTVQATESTNYARGGGLFAGANTTGASINMKYSEISGNQAQATEGNGAGLRNGAGIHHTNILNSTITGNVAGGKGGAVYLTGGGSATISISNSTISGNSAKASGGALLNLATQPGVRGDISVMSSTVTRNRSTEFVGGAGLRVLGNLELQSALVSGNTGPNGNASDVHHSPGDLTGADNLVGVGEAPAPGLIRTNDPRLGGLSFNGGPTRTHALLRDSPAMNAGNVAVATTTDQRGPGFPRVRGARADIGAFERDPDVIFADGFQ